MQREASMRGVMTGSSKNILAFQYLGLFFMELSKIRSQKQSNSKEDGKQKSAQRKFFQFRVKRLRILIVIYSPEMLKNRNKGDDKQKLVRALEIDGCIQQCKQK